MTYKCSCCGTIFTEPFTYTERENLDGERGIETRTVAACPYCGEEDFEEEEDAAQDFD